MTNSIALTLELEKERFGKGRKRRTDSRNSSLISDIKKIANDSLFFFGVFLVVLVVLQYIPTVSGLVDGLQIGINEVAVSFLGFVNIFFVQFFAKKLNTSK